MPGFLALAILAGACAHEAPEPPPLTPVRVESVGGATSASSLRYSAAILPGRRVDLAFKAPGYIGDISQVSDGGRILQEGDRVRRGQVLARIRPDDFQAKVNQARSQQQEVDAAFAQAQQAWDRSRQLYERKSITRTDYDAAKAAYDMVVARRDGARALVTEANNALADSSLTSPLDGVIIKRLIEVGSLVGPGAPGFVIADNTTVKVLFGAPHEVVKGLTVRQPMTITTESYPNERFQGRITSLAPAADPGSLVFDVELTLPNADGRLKPGMVATLEIARGEQREQLTVPLAAIIRSTQDPDGYAVFVVEEREGKSYAKRRDVALGAMVGNTVAVSDGLRSGERVIVTGATIVADGEAVEVLR
jgi:multidrug efflux system membrane fusion protein